MSKKVLITSALPYVNNVPHLGNIVGCVLPGDVLSRYYKGINRNVLYICGTDEYGTTTELKAIEEGITYRALCNKYFEIHKEIYKWFNIEFDHFGRTSTENPKTDDWIHTKIAQSIFEKLMANGYIVEHEVTQLYCEELDIFCADRYVIGTCPNCGNDKAKGDQCDICSHMLDAIDLINPVYKLNNSYKLIPKLTKHLFLDIPKLTDKLTAWLQTTMYRWSPNAISITESWLQNKKCIERCITRDMKWGTPLPTISLPEEYSNKIMYNWFDAPIGYMSITAQYTDDWRNWWMDPENTELIQTYSKDNIPFHTIMFPATLLGTDENYTLVSKVASCDYLTYEGGKFSKSEGLGVFGDQVMSISSKLGINEDYWRYYLMRIRPEKHDTSFSWREFSDLCTADLVKNFGNFINRCITMTKKFCLVNSTSVPVDLSFGITEINSITDLLVSYHKYFETMELKEALLIPIKITDIGNKFLQTYKPWDLYKKGDENVPKILGVSLWIGIWAARYLEPFIPNTSKYITNYIKLEGLDLHSIFQDPTIFSSQLNNYRIGLSTDEYIVPFKPLVIPPDILTSI